MRLRPASAAVASSGSGTILGTKHPTGPTSSTTSRRLPGPSLSNQRRPKRFIAGLLMAVATLLALYVLGSFMYLGQHVPPLAHVHESHRLSGAGEAISLRMHVTRASKTTMDWKVHASRVSAWLEESSGDRRKRITAYLEPLWNVTASQTAQGKSYLEPLPLRTQSPQELQKVVYPKLQSCRDMPARFPIDRGVQYDTDGTTVIVTNVGDQIRSPTFLQEQTQYCPVDADPYLPWIHDVFYSDKHKKIHFVAHNKRRCQTGSRHADELERLEPQVALLQSVPIQRITQEQVVKLAPELWKKNATTASSSSSASRYRLVPYEQADADAQYTRFICRFHTYDMDAASSSNHRRLELGETLSEFPLNYELAAYRKTNHHGGLLSPQGKDNGKFWTSTLLFSCPLPQSLFQQQQQEEHMDQASFWTTPRHQLPLVHVDIIPIRTPARFPPATSSEEAVKDDGGFYLSAEQIGPTLASSLSFDPRKAWGERQVLPMVEASGRWENIPICPLKSPVSLKADTSAVSGAANVASSPTNPSKKKKKPYLLSACLWAAASFRTRGRHDPSHSVDDTQDRLREWLEFHFMVGFDHTFVYDNSGAFGNRTGLKATLDEFPSHQVTWIDWPSQVCNNNIPAHDNTGERSSQYAAENSCRARYGPYTEWIASFDTDEYLIPQGSHTSLRSVVEQATDANILSFKSSRGKLRYDFSEASNKGGRPKLPNATFLQAMNCDGSPLPRPDWADRARKQLYRADYVLNHFVHYSTVTKAHMITYQEAQTAGESWNRYQPPDPTERNVDELTEATMIHTKSLDYAQTLNWKNKCRFDFPRKYLGCHVGFPWPNNTVSSTETYDKTTGWDYNCFVNQRVDDYWAPRLRQAMEERRKQQRASIED